MQASWTQLQSCSEPSLSSVWPFSGKSNPHDVSSRCAVLLEPAGELFKATSRFIYCTSEELLQTLQHSLGSWESWCLCTRQLITANDVGALPEARWMLGCVTTSIGTVCFGFFHYRSSPLAMPMQSVDLTRNENCLINFSGLLGVGAQCKVQQDLVADLLAICWMCSHNAVG